jgi:hypothetical protein
VAEVSGYVLTDGQGMVLGYVDMFFTDPLPAFTLNGDFLMIEVQYSCFYNYNGLTGARRGGPPAGAPAISP